MGSLSQALDLRLQTKLVQKLRPELTLQTELDVRFKAAFAMLPTYMKGEVNRRSYKHENYVFGRSVSEYILEEFSLIEKDFGGESPSFKKILHLGLGEGHDLAYLPEAMERSLEVILVDASRVVINRVKQRVKKIILRPEESEILLDGALYAPRKYINQKTIIRGDDRIPIIAAASIVAKVVRDRKMKRLSKKFPAYNFEEHKGYGTKEHYKALKKHGFCVIHRHSFIHLDTVVK